MSYITDDIRDAIAKHIPSQIGEQLRLRLENADKDEKEVSRLTALLNDTRKLLEESNRKVAEHKSIDDRLQHVQTIEKEVSGRLLRAEINDLIAKSADRRCQDLKDVVGLVFANNHYKYRMTSRQDAFQPNTTYAQKDTLGKEVEIVTES